MMQRGLKSLTAALIIFVGVVLVVHLTGRQGLDAEGAVPLLRMAAMRMTGTVEPKNGTEDDIRACSLDTFQKYVAEHDSFPAGGHWKSVGEKDKEVFRPDTCAFQHRTQIPADYLKQCLAQNKLGKVLMLGDSNGKHYYNEFMATVKKSGFQCQLLKAEGGQEFNADAKYFTNGTSIKVGDVRTQTRGCRTCRSELRKCTETSGSDPFVLLVEFLLMEFYLDAEIITFRSSLVKNCPPAPQTCVHSNTYQEFIFMEYLKGNFPDLIVFFGNNHSIRRKQMFQIVPSMHMLASIVENTVPKSTPVIWVSGTGEYDPKKPAVWRKVRFGPQKNTAEEMVGIINQALFEVLKTHLRSKDTNAFAFLDLDDVAKEVKARWSTDGVHSQGVWYQHIMSYLVQSVCNSKALTKVRRQ